MRRRWPLVLYHGTTIDRLSGILESGLEPSEGWGSAGTEGVFLSGTEAGALSWAKIRLMRDMGWSKWEDRYFSERLGRDGLLCLVVLRVRVPESAQGGLRADMEQAEDFGFEGEPEDWESALDEMGELMFDGEIPASWIDVPDYLDARERNRRLRILERLVRKEGEGDET